MSKRGIGGYGNSPLYSMITMLSIYIPLMLTIYTTHEIYNFNNPRINPQGYYILCHWEEDDFYTNINGTKIPYPEAKADNFFKKNARKKYWRKKQLGRE